jgi:hypothetical protein
MSDRQELLAALEAAHAAAARLPPCDRAARLHALLTRIQPTIDDSTTAASASELARAAVAALEDDPWAQFELAARRLHDVALAAVAAPPEPASSRAPTSAAC